MPKPFADRLQDYTRSLNEADTALRKMDIQGVHEAGQRTTENMVAMLQNLDGRVAGIEGRLSAVARGIEESRRARIYGDSANDA